MKIFAIIFLVSLGFFLVSCEEEKPSSGAVSEKIFEDLYLEEDEAKDVDTNKIGETEKDSGNFSQKFISSSLSTNTDKTSIDLNLVLGGGPAKDGIPALNNPQFVDIGDAETKMSFLDDGSTGISVEQNGEAKFYPYNILVWHEIVNDTIGKIQIAVTFCPLCGSAIVYDRMVDGEKLRFGVSGKLYESNLLMYDTGSESLWSQSLGEAVVGDKLGLKLEYVQSNLMSLAEFKKIYPEGKVLSDETGFTRNYHEIPYGNYDDSDDLYFPVENSDVRFHKKELFYIVNFGNDSVAFLLKDLREFGGGEIEVGENLYKASFIDGIIDVSINDQIIPGYYEMWFSWVNHNNNSKNVWKN